MKWSILLFKLVILLLPLHIATANQGDVVINEISWMGTSVAHTDEWLELYNNTNQEIILEGWILRSTDDTPDIKLDGIIYPNGFFVLERTDDSTLPNIPADQIYTGALGNSGEHLELLDAQEILIDDVNSWGNWFAGDNSTKQTMERKNSQLSGSDPGNWTTSLEEGGTPHTVNSVAEPAQDSNSDADEIQAEQQQANENIESDGNYTPANQNSTTSTIDEQSQLQQEEQQTQGIQQDQGYADQSITSTDILANSEIIDAKGLGNASTTKPTATSTPQTIKEYSRNILINEIMPSPVGADKDMEWIEIINGNEFPADISLFKIEDGVGETAIYQLPQGSIIAPSSFLVLSRPTTKITLNNEQDSIVFTRPDDQVIQIVNYANSKEGQSYARSMNKWQWTTTPSPASANIITQPPAPKKQSEKAQIDPLTSTKNPKSPPDFFSRPLSFKLNESSTTLASPNNTNSTHTDAYAIDTQTSTLVAFIGSDQQNDPKWLIFITASLVGLLSVNLVFLLKKRLS